MRGAGTRKREAAVTPHDRTREAIAEAKGLCETSAMLIGDSKALVEKLARIVASLKARVR
jgi:hypothetical protein